MPNVAIVTDSVATIPVAMMDSLQIHWVPCYIHRGNEVLVDLVTIQPSEFYAWLPTARELPKTATPGAGVFMEMYEALERKGVREIVSIHITSKGSAVYEAALDARNLIKEKLPHLKIEVIDTLNVSMCEGWMVIEAARAALAGKSMVEIIDLVCKMIPMTRMLQTADTLRYLFMGGRIGRASHLVGSLLNLRPIISMEDGVIVPLGVARSRLKSYEMIVDLVAKAIGSEGKVKIAYVHAAALNEAEKLRQMIHARINVVEELFAELSPVLGVHSGPGTVGVCYYPVLDT